MTLEELQRRLAACEDVSQEDVAPFFLSTDAGERKDARDALARTALREALQACADLARDQEYTEQSTLNAIKQLSTLSDDLDPYIATLKGLGLKAAARGDAEKSLPLLQDALAVAFTCGQRRDERSRRCMRYAHDMEIVAAIEGFAAQITPPATRPPSVEPYRIALLCSSIVDEDAPTIYTIKRAQLLRECGFDVTLVSSEIVNSTGQGMEAHVGRLGIRFVKLPSESWISRIRALLQFFTDYPVHAVLYEASGLDNLARLAACVGLAPVQAWDNKGMEPLCGKLDIVAQTMPEQETTTRWPGIAKFYGTPIVAADEIEDARPFTRAELGVPGDAVLLATFGRMEKCNTETYLAGIVAILASEPQAWLLLAGPDNMGQMPEMQSYFDAHGVAGRIRYLGRQQAAAPRLVKSIDVYCDTYPWPGGQSLLDAMQAGVAIVAMHRANDPNLDATGAGISAVADIILGDLIELAAAGDAQDYARIGLRYIRDPGHRAHVGALLRAKALQDFSMRANTERLAADLRALIAERCGGGVAAS